MLSIDHFITHKIVGGYKFIINYINYVIIRLFKYCSIYITLIITILTVNNKTNDFFHLTE